MAEIYLAQRAKNSYHKGTPLFLVAGGWEKEPDRAKVWGSFSFSHHKPYFTAQCGKDQPTWGSKNAVKNGTKKSPVFNLRIKQNAVKGPNSGI